ncbi:MAG: divergent polysaccharide deacetylase family protein [Candidatus Omnitrophota bacterium]
MKKSNQPPKSNHSFLKLLVLLVAAAAMTILVLEFIDLKKNGNSYIFTKIIPLESNDASVNRLNAKLFSIVKVNKIRFDYFSDPQHRFHFRLDIDDARYNKLIEKINSAVTHLKGVMELSEVQELKDKSVVFYKVSFNDKVTHLLLITKFKKSAAATEPPTEPRPVVPEEKDETEAKPAESGSPQPEEPRPPVSGRTPKIAFIIDDMGVYDTNADDLKRLGIPITASVLPDSRRAHEVVHELEADGLKALIHLPMQPENSNGKRYNADEVITMNATDDQIRSLILKAKKVVTSATGLNNHEGSRVTADRPLMTRILKIIKEQNLFFIDSRTSGHTIGYELAKTMHVRATHKDIFIDHIPGYANAMAQIRKLVQMAQQNGKAIAIGHPFPTTLQAIHDSIDDIKSKGIEIVWASDLLE